MIATSTLVDVVLVALAVEASILLVAGRRFGLPPFRRLWPNLAAGLFLTIALRVTAPDGEALMVAPLLLAAGLAHAVDLFVRTRG